MKIACHGNISQKPSLKAIDFFCGAGGMSFGLSKAGIDVLAGIDNDPMCGETYSINNKNARFINRDISKLLCTELSQALGVRRNDDHLVLVGCSPCQFWSKIHTDKRKSEASAFLLKEFERFVEWFNPGFIIIENVPGLLKNKDHDILPQFHDFLTKNKYTYDHGIINSNFYGVPQNRTRYLLIATRLKGGITLPRGRKNNRLTVRNFIGQNNGFPQIKAGHWDATDFLHTASALSPKNLNRIRRTSVDGGTRVGWRDDPRLQIKAYKDKDHIFRNVYGRMYWDQPAPTVTTRFNSLSNGRFGHPEEDRAISYREGATLQTFPKNYIFKGPNLAAIARQIGNAVPPALAERIGKHLIKHLLKLTDNGPISD